MSKDLCIYKCLHHSITSFTTVDVTYEINRSFLFLSLIESIIEIEI